METHCPLLLLKGPESTQSAEHKQFYMSMSKAVQESSRWCKRQSEPWKRGQNVSFESLSWQRNSKLHSIILVPANAKADDDVWCEARPFGVNSLANLMKRISEAAGLSKIYTCTNHNIRATATTLWSNGVVRSRHIMSNSHHRNEQSLAHCNSCPSFSQVHICSDVLRALSGGKQTCHPSGQQIDKRSTSCHQQTSPSQAAKAVPIFKEWAIHNVQLVFRSSETRSLFFFT